MNKSIQYAIAAGISFLLFEGIFWEWGINIFDCLSNGYVYHYTFENFAMITLSLICFILFIISMGNSLYWRLKEE